MDEQRVRTEAGWIGVEISKSRVRTPGKAGYGLYRVRTAAVPHWHVGQPPDAPAGEWTAYAFTLEAIFEAVQTSIQVGTPEGPFPLKLLSDVGDGVHKAGHSIPTRWTSAYRGRRNLGVAAPATVRPEFADELSALAALLDAGLVEMDHAEGCACRGTEELTAECVRWTLEAARPAAELFPCLNEEPDGERCAGTVRIEPGAPQGRCGTCGGWVGTAAPSTVRARQRAANAEFQRKHAPARTYGLRERHRAKLATRPPAERHADD
jgi:hypothetical protein